MEKENNASVDGQVGEKLENGSNGATQEVTSTTPQVNEITKRSLRVQTWKKIQDNKLSASYSLFNRIPQFVGDDKAADNLVNCDEFIKSQHIKINIDRALQAAKTKTLLAGKNLYLPGTRESTALFLKVDAPADASDEEKLAVLNTQDVQKHRIDINLENKIPLDMIIIGSVVVSREGYRIGRGNGFTDLDIGLLIEVGVITPSTVIATLVHDVQVVDTLPVNLFQKYDAPVDLIITPTEVIRVANRLPRPSGLYWELLSERRLKIIPVLGVLRNKLKEEGKEITLKEYDTDVEQYQNNRSRNRGPLRRRRYGRRIPQRRAHSQTDTEQHGENNTQGRRYTRGRPRRFMNRRRRTTKSEGDQSGVDGGGKSQERKQGRGEGNGNAGGNGRKQKPRRTPQRDFCVKLTNISRDVRVKDIKTELKRRECTPLFISWKGQFGKCFLHFGNRDGTPSTEDDMNKVMKALSDLSLTVNVGGGNGNNNEATATNNSETAVNEEQTKTKTVNVNVELIKYNNNKQASNNGNEIAAANGGEADVSAGGDAAGGDRIESVDTTTV